MEIISQYGFVLMVLAVVFGLYMTWGIGANDVANAMGTSVGSGAITVKQAIIIAAIFEFAGAFIAGGHVTKTIRKGIIDPTPIIRFTTPNGGPAYVFLVGFIISLVAMFKGLKHLNLELSAGMSFVAALVFGLIVAGVGWALIKRVKVDPGADRDYHFASVEKVFAPMMIFTACAMAFAHGSNDVASGIGPLAAVVSIVQSGGEVTQKAGLPLWILVLGGVGIVVGLATMGYKVMRTIGTRITELTPSRGYCATLAAAATVVLASRTGLPVSTTHIAVGAVIGVGLARGIGAIDVRVIGGIVMSWLVMLPVGGCSLR